MKKKRKMFCFLLSLSLIFTMTFGSVSVSAAPKLNKTKVTLLNICERRRANISNTAKYKFIIQSKTMLNTAAPERTIL